MNYPEVLRFLPWLQTARSQNCSYKKGPRSQDNFAGIGLLTDQRRAAYAATRKSWFRHEGTTRILRATNRMFTKPPVISAAGPFSKGGCGTRVTLMKPAVHPSPVASTNNLCAN